MGRIFDMDSPVMRFLGRLADLMILNLVTLLCCLPVVTIGASLTAMHYVLLKMVRNEESYIVRSFFKSFKENFKQATGIYLIMTALGIVIGTDIYFWTNLEGTVATVMSAVSIGAACFLSMGLIYVFVLQATFENPVKRTIINSFLIALQRFPVTLLLAAYYGVILYFIIQFFVVDAFMVLYGFGLSALGSAVFYGLALKKYIKKAEEASEETTLVSDEKKETQ